MLINLSNHTSTTWTEAQRNEAEKRFGEVADLPFPRIEPAWELAKIQMLAREYLEHAVQAAGDKLDQLTVHVMGEMTFVYEFVRRAERQGIPCVASTAERVVEEREDGSRISRFTFVAFRPYFKSE